ncbi:hypothetical protein L4C31_01405 [Aliivibrio sifiae]
MSKTKKQKLLYSIMVVTMIGNMAYSHFSNSNKATQRALAKQRQTWELKQAASPTIKSPTQPTSLIKEKPTSTAPLVAVSLGLSDDAKASLVSLKKAYISDIKTIANHAKIAEIESSQQLNALQHPAPIKKKETISTPKKPTYVPTRPVASASLLEQVKVKSIFFSNKRVVAWLDLDGQLVPVKKGAHIWGAIVTDITKNSVIFNNQGHKVTRYKMPPQPKKKDTDNKANKDMT